MLWYNILNPENWPGVNIKTGNKKIDGVYYNLLSSNHISLAASGSMFLAANSGIKLISKSYVDTSGIRAASILAEDYKKINSVGELVPLYGGEPSGIMVKVGDNTLYSSNIITYNSSSDELRFPSANDGNVFYTVPFYRLLGTGILPTKKIASFPHMSLTPASTDSEGVTTDPARVNITAKLIASSGISISPDLDSYEGFILTHAGSGNVAEWKPATYLRENYDTLLPLSGIERVGINWIRYPRRPAAIFNGKLHVYTEQRLWSPYPPIASLESFKQEFGTGSDTLCVTKVFGEQIIGYTKFAFSDKAVSEQSINTSFNFDDRISIGSILDPNRPDPTDLTETPCFVIDIAPENPGGINDGIVTNILIFSVTKGAYFPMQIEPTAKTNITLRHNDGIALTGAIKNRDDGTLLDSPISVNLSFKPSTLNNISIRPSIHTSFNMLGEDIDFLVYGKQYTDFNTYSGIFDLTENFIPTGLVPILKIDATIPNSVVGSPTGIVYSKFIDRQKTKPIGWNFDHSGKVCIKTHNAYEMSSIASGENYLRSYADLTIDGHTYTKSLIADDIYLKPLPLNDNTGKYIKNALLTINSAGQIISRTPRINPILPEAPSGITISIFGNQACSLNWSAPDKDGNSRILEYMLQASVNDGISWIDLPINSIEIIRGFNSQTTATIAPMDIINNATFRVAARNSIGIGDYSEPTNTKYINNINSPKHPTNFIFNRNIDNESISDITLSWAWDDQVQTWGSGSSPSGFLIEESSYDGISYTAFSGIVFVDHNPSITSYSHNETGLNGKDNYLYRISTINSNSIASPYNYIYSTGLLVLDIDIEEEENKRTEELSNFDFGVIMFTGICQI